MEKVMRVTRFVFAPVAVVAFLYGCAGFGVTDAETNARERQAEAAQSPSHGFPVRHVTEEVRATIHTIGIEVAEELPRVTLDLPAKGAGSGAGRIAGKWSENWLMAAAAAPSGGLGGILLSGAMFVVTPVVAGAGAAYGAIKAPPAEQVESQEAQVRGVVQAGDLTHRLQKHVLTHVTDRTDLSVSTLLRAASDPLGDRETVASSGMPQPDATLRILLESIALQGKPDVDPPLALHVIARVTLVAPSATTPLHAQTLHYVTGMRRLTEWTADDANPFRGAVDLSLARLAELMVDDLFLTHPFVHEHPRARHGS